MKKKTCKIIISIAMCIMLFTSFSSVFAEVNQTYTVETRVLDSALDKKIGESLLLDALANSINAVASLA